MSLQEKNDTSNWAKSHSSSLKETRINLSIFKSSSKVEKNTRSYTFFIRSSERNSEILWFWSFKILPEWELRIVLKSSKLQKLESDHETDWMVEKKHQSESKEKKIRRTCSYILADNSQSQRNLKIEEKSYISQNI